MMWPYSQSGSDSARSATARLPGPARKTAPRVRSRRPVRAGRSPQRPAARTPGRPAPAVCTRRGAQHLLGIAENDHASSSSGMSPAVHGDPGSRASSAAPRRESSSRPASSRPAGVSRSLIRSAALNRGQQSSTDCSEVIRRHDRAHHPALARQLRIDLSQPADRQSEAAAWRRRSAPGCGAAASAVARARAVAMSCGVSTSSWSSNSTTSGSAGTRWRAATAASTRSAIRRSALRVATSVGSRPVTSIVGHQALDGREEHASLTE